MSSDQAPIPAPPDETPLLLRPRVVIGIAAGFVALAALYVLVALWFDFSFTVEPEPLQDWVEDRGPLAPAFFIALMAAAVLFAVVPNAPIFFAAGLVWGPVLGSVYSIVGTTVGSVLAFAISRWFGRPYLNRLIGEKLARRVDEASTSFGGRLVFWARLFPGTSFDWISFAAGLTAMRFRTFFIYTLLGLSPPTILMVAAGDSLTRDLRVTFALGAVWVAVLVLGAAYLWWQRSRRGGKREERPAVPSGE